MMLTGQLSDVLLRGMESKPTNWKKIFEDNTHNTKGIYDAIVKEEKERKPKGGSTGDAAASGKSSSSSRSRKQGTGAKGGKARSGKGKTALSSNYDAFPAYSVGASLDTAGQMMFEPPSAAISTQAAVPMPELLLDPEAALHDDNFPDFGFDFSESNGYL